MEMPLLEKRRSAICWLCRNFPTFCLSCCPRLVLCSRPSLRSARCRQLLRRNRALRAVQFIEIASQHRVAVGRAVWHQGRRPQLRPASLAAAISSSRVPAVVHHRAHQKQTSSTSNLQTKRDRPWSCAVLQPIRIFPRSHLYLAKPSGRFLCRARANFQQLAIKQMVTASS